MTRSAFTVVLCRFFGWETPKPETATFKDVPVTAWYAGAVEAAYEKGMRHFLCGMARGADFYCCEAALALRERRPGVTVEAVIPCEEQAARWRERDRERWFSLVERCDNETMLQHHYDRGCMLRRNRYLVDHSAMLIAVYDGMLGGTMYTISYAMKRGLDVVTLDIP